MHIHVFSSTLKYTIQYHTTHRTPTIDMEHIQQLLKIMSLFYSQSKILFLGLARYQDPSLLQLPCLTSLFIRSIRHSEEKDKILDPTAVLRERLLSDLSS